MWTLRSARWANTLPHWKKIFLSFFLSLVISLATSLSQQLASREDHLPKLGILIDQIDYLLIDEYLELQVQLKAEAR